MKKLLEKYGEPWDERFLADFDLEEDGTTKVADFFNNGGLVLNNDRAKEHCAVVYVALVDGSIDIGCWLWKYDEDFDEDAEWHVLGLEVFTEPERKAICDKIVEIYKK